MSRSKESDGTSGLDRVNLAYRCSGLKISTKSLLVYLALRHNELKGCAWASVGDMMHSCSMSATCVKDNLKILKDMKLIERKLRDESVTKSRKTIINWDAVKAREVHYRPKLEAVAPVTTPAAIIVADAVIADTLDGQVEEVDDESPTTEDRYALTDDIIALLKTHFGQHSTFSLPDWNHVMKACVRACIDEAGSGDACLDVLTTVCTTKAFAQTRQSVNKSFKLGGYIRQSFPGWVSASAEDNIWNQTLDGMCEGAARFEHHLGPAYAPQEASAIQSFKKWLKEELGSYLLSIQDHKDDNSGDWIEVEVPRSYLAARLLERHTGQKVNPEGLPDGEDLRVAEVALWAVNDDQWGEHLKNAFDAEGFFLANFNEMRQGYEIQREDDDDSFELELPEPSEEYAS